MGAVICRKGGATAYAPAKFEYEAAWPCPALGDLHRSFRELPGPEDAEVLIQVITHPIKLSTERGVDAIGMCTGQPYRISFRATRDQQQHGTRTMTMRRRGG